MTPTEYEQEAGVWFLIIVLSAFLVLLWSCLAPASFTDDLDREIIEETLDEMAHRSALKTDSVLADELKELTELRLRLVNLLRQPIEIICRDCSLMIHKEVE